MDFSRPHDFIPLPHGRVAHFRSGQGPDLLFVHGWPLHAATFRHLAPLLAQRFTVHLVDLPGTGHTEWTGPINLREQATTVRAVADHLRLQRYALLAHDSGGAIARILAADDPRVAALVLGNTEIPFHHPWQVKLYVAATKLPGGAALLLAAMRLAVVRRSMLGFGGCFRDPRTAEGEFGALFVRPLLEDRAIAAGQFELARNYDPRVVDDLANVHARIPPPPCCSGALRIPSSPWPRRARCSLSFPAARSSSPSKAQSSSPTKTNRKPSRAMRHRSSSEPSIRQW